MVAKKVIGLVLIALMATELPAFAGPSAAKVPECADYDQTLVALKGLGEAPVEIPSERLTKTVVDAETITGDSYIGVSRGFLLVGNAMTALGLEIGGCLLDPILIRVPHANTSI